MRGSNAQRNVSEILRLARLEWETLPTGRENKGERKFASAYRDEECEQFVRKK